MDVLNNRKILKDQSSYLGICFLFFIFSSTLICFYSEKHNCLYLIPIVFSVALLMFYKVQLKKHLIELELLEFKYEESQSLANIGNWNFNFLTNDMDWSSENYRIFEIAETQSRESLFLIFRSRIHPEDLLKLDEMIMYSKLTGKDFVYFHRLIFENNRIKYVQGIGKTYLDKKGNAISLLGTCQDLTKMTADKIFIENQTLKFSELFKGINDSAIVTITDESGKINYANDKFIEISGYTRKELLGCNHRIVNSGIHSKEFFSEMWKVISSGKVWNGEICNRRKDGSLYWVHTVISSSKNSLGVIQFMSIRFEITEQKNYEIKLLDSEQRWKFAIEGSGDGIWDWKISENKVFYSARLIEIMGYENHEIEEKIEEIKNRIHPDDKDNFLKNLQNHLDSDKNFCLEHRIICKDGTSKWILDRGMVMSRDLVGAPLRMVGTFSDITNLKEVEFKMNQASKLISMGEMAAGLAHEVNNPLTIIAASLKFLTKFKDDPENFAASIQKIQKNTDRISKIIKGLKKFSRISEENNYLNCSLDIIVKEALSLTESKAKLENTIVTYDLQENLYIFCDEIGIEQVLINLINNAIDAIKNSENRWVKIQLSSDTNSVILRIIDSGSGIPEKISLKLFDPFFTTKVVGEGTGLGLSITKGILDKHNATICVLPNEKNTCFEIRFQKTEVTNVT